MTKKEAKQQLESTDDPAIDAIQAMVFEITWRLAMQEATRIADGMPSELDVSEESAPDYVIGYYDGCAEIAQELKEAQ